jgi:hypothetical protein
LERFIGRGVVRKRADDFDYHAVPAASPERNRPFTQSKSPSSGNRSARTPSGDTHWNRRKGGRRFRGR